MLEMLVGQQEIMRQEQVQVPQVLILIHIVQQQVLQKEVGQQQA